MQLSALASPPVSAPLWTTPAGTRIGAIDCGSNAIRAAIADVTPDGVFVVERIREPVRLAGDVFAAGLIGPELADRVIAAFRRFSRRFAELGVDSHVAVATSAMRNAENGEHLLAQILTQTGIHLQTISGEREAALVRYAVIASSPNGHVPDVIADLGGGSLELQHLAGGRRIGGAVLPVGTVRLSTMGAMTDDQVAWIRNTVRAALDSRVGAAPDARRIAICGGNAKALCKLFPAARIAGQRALDIGALRDELGTLCRSGVAERMRTYGVRLDRAEVMGTAAVVFDTLAEWLGTGHMTCPGVGVLDGLFAQQVVALAA